MPSSLDKIKLSGSTDGRGIKVAATSSPGTTIHTSVSGTTAGTFDEIFLFAYNGDTVTRNLTVQFGGTTSPDDDVYQSIPSKQGLTLVIPGLILQNGSIVKAYADAANVIVIQGYVNQITH